MMNREQVTRLVRQPIRATFLLGIEPKAAETIRAFADLVESSLYESHPSKPGPVPHNMLMLDAALIDLEALTIHLKDLREHWREEEGERGPLRDALAVLLAGIEAGERFVREALAAEAHDGA